MAEMDLTKKITRIVKGTDKLIRNVMKDANELKSSINSLRDSFKKPEDKSRD